MLPLLSSFFFGSVEHYRLLARHEKVMIDTGEHYVRQSYRTRTRIIGPNGPQDLAVRVQHDHGRKIPMRDVRLSHAEPWPQQHLHAIRSAYGSTPWFIHYIDTVEELLLTRHERLIDLHIAALDRCMRWLGVTTEVLVADNYMEKLDGFTDLRTSLHPKRTLPTEVTPVPPYPQVFADRHGFVARASVLDLLFNAGPRAKELLLRDQGSSSPAKG